MQAASMRQERLARTIERIKRKAEVLQQSHIEVQRKVEIINEYTQTQGIRVKASERLRMIKFMRVPEIQMILEKKVMRRKEHKAATKIQSMVRGYLIWKRYQIKKALRL
jgi:IQ calmodulin-binding motif